MSRIVNTNLISNSRLEDIQALVDVDLKEKTDAEIDEIVYQLAIKHINPEVIRAGVEESKRGGGHSFEEILKDADALQAQGQRCCKARI